jgi:hypothetical protein
MHNDSDRKLFLRLEVVDADGRATGIWTTIESCLSAEDVRACVDGKAGPAPASLAIRAAAAADLTLTQHLDGAAKAHLDWEWEQGVRA